MESTEKYRKEIPIWRLCDAAPSSLMDSTLSPKVKTTEGEGVGVRSLAYNTLWVEGHVEL